MKICFNRAVKSKNIKTFHFIIILNIIILLNNLYSHTDNIKIERFDSLELTRFIVEHDAKI